MADQQGPVKESKPATAALCFRMEVKTWLASIGADHSIPPKKQAGLPKLTEEQWQQLQPKAGRVVPAASKEPAAAAAAAAAIPVQPKEASVPVKEASTKTKETPAPKPKGRPRYYWPSLQHVSYVLQRVCIACCLTSYCGTPGRSAIIITRLVISP